MLIHPDKDFKHPSNTGRYETGILCGKCDGKLGVYEGSALSLLRRLRARKVGKKVGTESTIAEGSYPFRVKEVDELIRFACGILWKYASTESTNPAHIELGSYLKTFEDICFHGGSVPSDVDGFLERDLFSFAAFTDPNDVYYYRTPSIGHRGYQQLAHMGWFNVGGFMIYVRMDEEGPSDFAPRRCWMRGKKQCYFNVSLRSLQENVEVATSIGMVKEDLARLNRKLVFPSKSR